MTKPVTYYAQSQPIESLIEKYGSSFESLTKPEKLFFLALIAESLSEGLFEVKNVHDRTISIEFMEDALRLIQVAPERDLTGLSMAIAAQLYDRVYAEENPS